jgi:folylpolyglutamate synthase
VGAVGSYYFLYTSLANSRLVLQSSHDQHVYPEIWKRLHPGSTVSFEATIRGALEKVREIGKEYGSVQTLVTGSQHLVGGVLSLLESSARV